MKKQISLSRKRIIIEQVKWLKLAQTNQQQQKHIFKNQNK